MEYKHRPNDEQLAAIEAPVEGSYRVLAPPGSGKTFLLVHRYAFLVEQGVDPRNIVMVVFYTGYIFYLNWKLAIAGIITIPLIVIVLPWFNRKLARLSGEYSDSMGRMSDCLLESFSGVGEIRANQTYRYEESRLDARTKEIFGINMGQMGVGRGEIGVQLNGLFSIGLGALVAFQRDPFAVQV